MWKGEWFAEGIFQSSGSLDAEISKGIGLLSGKGKDEGYLLGGR